MLGQILNRVIKVRLPDKALRNAIGNNDIRKAGAQPGEYAGYGYPFFHQGGFQKAHHRPEAWPLSNAATGLNVMRAKALARYGFPAFELSEIYPFFWDQLEKSNLFLQGIIDTADKPLDDKTVEWLLKHPLSDGGTFTGVADIVSKYGLVPKSAMPETNSSENTARMANLISLKLKDTPSSATLLPKAPSLPLWRKRKPPCWALSFARWC